MEWAEVGHHSDRDRWISECPRVLRPPLSHHGIHLYGDGSFLDFLYLSALKLLLCSEKPSYLPSLNIPQAESGRDSRSVDSGGKVHGSAPAQLHRSPCLRAVGPGWSFQLWGSFYQQTVLGGKHPGNKQIRMCFNLTASMAAAGASVTL